MSLRYRLFLWVSAVFVVSACIGYVSQTFMTRTALHKAKEELCQKILSSKAAVAKNLQEFLLYQIIENQARLDVVLNTISHSGPQLLKFAPTLENASRGGTWAGCIDVLEKDRWIDFIQNTNEGMATVIAPQTPPFRRAFRIPIDNELSWICYASVPEVYMGIKVFSGQQEYLLEDLNGEEIEEVIPPLPEIYVLFPWKLLAHMTRVSQELVLTPPWIGGREISLSPFLK